MSLLTTDEQYELATKIQTLIMFVGALNVKEVMGIQQMREQVEDQISSLSAVSGIITPLEESENKIAHYRCILKRCDAILAIHESNLDMAEADKKFEDSKKGREQIKELFGL